MSWISSQTCLMFVPPFGRELPRSSLAVKWLWREQAAIISNRGGTEVGMPGMQNARSFWDQKRKTTREGGRRRRREAAVHSAVSTEHFRHTLKGFFSVGCGTKSASWKFLVSGGGRCASCVLAETWKETFRSMKFKLDYQSVG